MRYRWSGKQPRQGRTSSDARSRHHPLGSFLTLLGEDPSAGPFSLRGGLDDYGPGTGGGERDGGKE
ncbi:hypothetical protein AMK27_11685 [Streptomyces sp. CB02009]|uniref:hypothetical protein n=1 Tax=Streptomyces sp. CB02009 TaxID=1703938 RepID=UPI00093F7220|nr:hypothetical protein [Streptomyces sp. CB02009]OKJ63523.1 hypothetical protein AMK27_11685 [Streptomyces sp. CB02009]